jgi:UPF0176 protein
MPLSSETDRPILWSFRRCPYAIRARLALKASGIAVTLREVVLRDKPAAFVAVSSKATVPVLQLSDGRVLDQSLDIMRWALSANDPHGWLRVDEEAAVQTLVTLNDGAFKRALDRYKYAPRHPERPATSYRDEAVDVLLAPLEHRLQAQRFLLRDTPSLADMAILPFVRQFAAVDAAWFAGAPLPRLRAWTAGLAASPQFDAVMVKFEAWRPGDADVLF